MRPNDVLVLCYHAVTNLCDDPILAEYGIPPDRFVEQLDLLRELGFNFISPNDFVMMLNGSATLPKRSILVTFDDCYEELVEVAKTILQPRGIQAIAFAVTGMQSGTNEWDQEIGATALRLLNPAGLKELISRGIEIGCHSRSHRPLTAIPPSKLKSETYSAAEDLACLGLPRPRFFAYPHGLHDEVVRTAVRQAGFGGAFALAPRRSSCDSDRFALPRIQVLSSDVGWRFWLKVTWPQLEPLVRWKSVLFRVARKMLPRRTQTQGP